MTENKANAADLLDAVAQAAAAHDMFRSGEVAVVAVSGGADSVALLDLLDRHRRHEGYDLVVAHLDHGLREESVDDAAFVAELAADRNLTADLGAADVPALAAAGPWSPEDAGRRARYAFLAAAAQRAGARVVATAHHGDDQAETVLLNIIRGTGVDGLAGMAFSAPWPITDKDIHALANLIGASRVPRTPHRPRLVRPLLALRRGQIAAYVAARGLPFREDPTNADVSIARNRVRHEVLPVLETLNGRVRDALLRLASTAAMDRDLLDAETNRAWAEVVDNRGTGFGVDRGSWDALAPALRRRLVRRMMDHLGADLRRLGPAHLDAVDALTADWRPGAEVALPGGLRAVLGYRAIVIGPASEIIPAPPGLGDEAVPLPLPGRLDLPSGWRIDTAIRPRTPADPPREADPWRAVMDATAVAKGLAVRRRRPGDQLSPIGMAGGHKSLQDLFTDDRVPRARRSGWPIVVTDDAVVWVPGLRLDDGVKVVPGTKEVVELVARPPKWGPGP